MSIFKLRNKKKKPKNEGPKSDLIKYIETNSTVAPNGKVYVLYKGGKKKKTFDWFPPAKPTEDILKAFVDTTKLPDITKYWYE